MMNWKISCATTKGLRAYQEDRFVHALIEKECPGYLLAVMDGHGGAQAVDIVCQALEDVFKRGCQHHLDDIEKVFVETFEILHEMTAEEHSGTSLSVVYVPKDKMYADIGILGDSPVVVSPEVGVITVGPEHNARSNLNERKKAIEKGAEYTSDGYISIPGSSKGLQLTRCLGDHPLNGILDRTPKVYREELRPESIIILGTDGLFDPGHADSKRLAHVLIHLVREGADAQDLINWRIQRIAQDNVTAIVVRG